MHILKEAEIARDALLSYSSSLDPNVWRWSEADRREVIKQWNVHYRSTLQLRQMEILDEYQRRCQAKRELDFQEQLRVMQNAVVVGMTASGCAIRQQLISALRPELIFVEEVIGVCSFPFSPTRSLSSLLRPVSDYLLFLFLSLCLSVSLLLVCDLALFCMSRLVNSSKGSC